MEVPTKTSLADIYPEDALQAQTTRWNNLLSTFKGTYGKSADFVSRSPGRVNIIGEVSKLSARRRPKDQSWKQD
jgi:galactokinase